MNAAEKLVTTQATMKGKEPAKTAIVKAPSLWTPATAVRRILQRNHDDNVEIAQQVSVKPRPAATVTLSNLSEEAEIEARAIVKKASKSKAPVDTVTCPAGQYNKNGVCVDYKSQKKLKELGLVKGDANYISRDPATGLWVGSNEAIKPNARKALLATLPAPEEGYKYVIHKNGTHEKIRLPTKKVPRTGAKAKKTKAFSEAGLKAVRKTITDSEGKKKHRVIYVDADTGKHVQGGRRIYMSAKDGEYRQKLLTALDKTSASLGRLQKRCETISDDIEYHTALMKSVMRIKPPKSAAKEARIAVAAIRRRFRYAKFDRKKILAKINQVIPPPPGKHWIWTEAHKDKTGKTIVGAPKLVKKVTKTGKGQQQKQKQTILHQKLAEDAGLETQKQDKKIVLADRYSKLVFPYTRLAKAAQSREYRAKMIQELQKKVKRMRREKSKCAGVANAISKNLRIRHRALGRSFNELSAINVDAAIRRRAIGSIRRRYVAI